MFLNLDDEGLFDYSWCEESQVSTLALSVNQPPLALSKVKISSI